MKELPTRDEFKELTALKIMNMVTPIGMEMAKRIIELENKAKNIKFPATEAEIYAQIDNYHKTKTNIK